MGPVRFITPLHLRTKGGDMQIPIHADEVRLHMQISMAHDFPAKPSAKLAVPAWSCRLKKPISTRFIHFHCIGLSFLRYMLPYEKMTHFCKILAIIRLTIMIFF